MLTLQEEICTGRREGREGDAAKTPHPGLEFRKPFLRGAFARSCANSSYWFMRGIGRECPLPPRKSVQYSEVSVQKILLILISSGGVACDSIECSMDDRKTFHTRCAQGAKVAKASAAKTPRLGHYSKNHFRMRRLRRIPSRPSRLERSGCENSSDQDASAQWSVL